MIWLVDLIYDMVSGVKEIVMPNPCIMGLEHYLTREVNTNE
jgi:hypothetical protein